MLVTGVFAATDPDDPVWTARPEILRPRVVGPSNAPTTVVGGLLSAASLPAARAALEPDGVTRTFRFPVDAEAVDYAGSGALATQVAALEASPELTTVRIFTIADFPPRRLVLVSPKASPLSLADQAVRETVLRIVAGARGRPPRELASND